MESAKTAGNEPAAQKSEILPVKFEDLNLNPHILKTIKEMGFSELTPIQQKCLPIIRQGKDVVGQSSTGSGKTVAFGIPIIEKIEPGKGLQALILTPTRELCVQVGDVIRNFGKYVPVRVSEVYGGVGIGPQINEIKRAEIVVGTPGRILDHMGRKTISFANVKYLVLDEADRMFDMGFIDDVEEIIYHVPKKRQTLLFGATINQELYKIVHKHLQAPISVKTQIYVNTNLLRQIYYNIGNQEKFSLLVHLLRNKTPGLALVFCATRREVNVITKNLIAHGIKALAIHGGLTQSRRLSALESLKKGHVRILVATDVAARGLDIKNVSHVYNYDAPKAPDEYIHRIGRTARAGEYGDAVTLLSERDYENFSRVLRDPSIEIKKEVPPAFEIVSFVRGQDRRRQRYFARKKTNYGRRRRDWYNR